MQCVPAPGDLHRSDDRRFRVSQSFDLSYGDEYSNTGCQFDPQATATAFVRRADGDFTALASFLACKRARRELHIDRGRNLSPSRHEFLST